MLIPIFHTSDNVDCRTKKKQTQQKPPPPPLSTAPCDTSTTLPTAPLNVRFYYRNTSKLSAFKFHLKCTRISSGSSVY